MSNDPMKQIEEFLGSLAEVALKDFLEGVQKRAKDKATVDIRRDALDRAMQSFSQHNVQPDSAVILKRATEFETFLRTGKGPSGE